MLPSPPTQERTAPGEVRRLLMNWNGIAGLEEGKEVHLLCELADRTTVTVQGYLYTDPNSPYGVASNVDLPGRPIGWAPIT